MKWYQVEVYENRVAVINIQEHSREDAFDKAEAIVDEYGIDQRFIVLEKDSGASKCRELHE